MGDHPACWIAVGAFIFLGTAYILGRAMESTAPQVALPLLHIGSWWLGVMAYLFLGCFLLDLLFLLNLWVPILPAEGFHWMGAYFVVLSVVILTAMVVGHLNVLYPKVRHLSTPSPAGLRIVVASDLHLCGLVSVRRIRHIVATIQSLKPDLILLPGDTVDEDIAHSPRSEPFRKELQQLKAPWGVMAVTGNHEWICGVESTSSWMESCGIRVLRDECLDLGPIVIAGRNDAASVRVNLAKQISLPQILSGTDSKKPVILMDHQPTRIQEAVEAHVDLLLCGHTHHGQFWPFQWITQHLFMISHGHRRIGTTDVYVSCGAGAWGPQVRTSSRSEILVLQ